MARGKKVIAPTTVDLARQLLGENTSVQSARMKWVGVRLLTGSRTLRPSAAAARCARCAGALWWDDWLGVANAKERAAAICGVGGAGRRGRCGPDGFVPSRRCPVLGCVGPVIEMVTSHRWWI
eukprot:2495301-Prymnesium_polylepis.1